MSNLIRDKYNKVDEAINKISALGYKVNKINNSEIWFYFNNKNVIYYPIKEWATGGSIKDCRGLGKLLEQIKPDNTYSSVITVNDIKNKLKEAILDTTEKKKKHEGDEFEVVFEASIDAFTFILEFIEGKQGKLSQLAVGKDRHF